MEGILLKLSDFALRLLSSAWFWTVLLFLVVWRLFTFIYRRMKLKALGKVIYSRSFSTDGIFVGETLELVETISNPSWFPLFSVEMEFFMPSGLTVDDITCKEYTKLTSIFNIPPYSTVKKVHTVKADRRDHYKLFSSNIKYRSFEYTYDSPIDFFAYPNRYDADASFSPDIFRAGESVSSQKYIEDSFFISGIRAYRPGDPMRSINFKASVRSFSGGIRRLMCNEYDSSRNYDSMIFLDLTEYSEASIDGTEQIELGLRYACYLLCEALKNSGNVGFSTNCTIGTSRYIYTPCGSSDLHTKRILEQFAEISPYAKRDFSIAAILQKVSLNLPKGTDIYFISPFVDDKTAEILHALKRMGQNVNVILLIRGESV